MSSSLPENEAELIADAALPTESDDLHHELLKWIDEWQDATQYNREQMLNDVKYRHHKQWTSEEVAVLEQRGQGAIVVNMIADKINFALGVEDDMRSDVRAYERTPLHGVDASIAEDAINYEDDRTNVDNEEILSISDAYTAGIAAVIFNHAKDAKGNFTIENVPWDRYVWDPRARRPDHSDARFKGVIVWRDYREALNDSRYKGRLHVLEAVKNTATVGIGDTLDDRPQLVWVAEDRVQIVEMYYQERNAAGKLEWWFAHFTYSGFLIEPILVPYKNDPPLGEKPKTWCPIVTLTAYMDEDNNPYSPIRGMVPLQDEVNKRRSKFLHQLSVRQVVVEEGMIDDDEALQTQLARPDGVIRVQTGGLKDKRFQLLPTSDLSQAQFSLYQDAVSALDSKGAQASLVNAQIRETSAVSFLAQQEAGTKELGLVRANVKAFKLQIRERIWWMVRQYRTREYWLRIRDVKEGSVRFVRMNRNTTKRDYAMALVRDEGISEQDAIARVFGPDGVSVFDIKMQEIRQRAEQANQIAAQKLQRGEPSAPPSEVPPGMIEAAAFDIVLSTDDARAPFTQNDVAKLDVDLVLELVSESSVVDHAQFESLVELARNGVAIPPKALIMASNTKDKRKLLKEMEPDPQVQQQQAEQVQAQLEKLQAEVAKLMADAQKSQAQAQALQVEAQTKGAVGQATVGKLGAETEKLSAETEILPEKGDKDAASALKFTAEAGAVAAGEPVIRPAERASRPGGDS